MTSKSKHLHRCAGSCLLFVITTCLEQTLPTQKALGTVLPVAGSAWAEGRGDQRRAEGDLLQPGAAEVLWPWVCARGIFLQPPRSCHSRVSFPGAASSLCRTFLIQLLQLQVPRAKSLLKTSVPLFDCFLAQRLGQASLPPLLGVICSRGASGKARAWPQLHCQSCCWASIETFIPLVPPHCTEQSRQGASGCLGPRCLLPNCFWDLPLGTNRR